MMISGNQYSLAGIPLTQQQIADNNSSRPGRPFTFTKEMLQKMRDAGFSEEEIAMRRMNREVGSRIDAQSFVREAQYQSGNGQRSNMGNAPSTQHLVTIESILLELINNAKNEADELHRTHFLRALQNNLSSVRSDLNVRGVGTENAGRLNVFA
jgi:hypothetical protein